MFKHKAINLYYEGGVKMKLINPLGRTPASSLFEGNEILPMACMCSTETAFVTTRGDDSCFKCGCSCSSTTYSAGNSQAAFWTIRKSGSIE